MIAIHKKKHKKLKKRNTKGEKKAQKRSQKLTLINFAVKLWQEVTLSGIHKQTQKAHQPSREPFDSEGCVLDQCTEGGIDGGFGVNKLITGFALHVSCLTLAKKTFCFSFCILTTPRWFIWKSCVSFAESLSGKLNTTLWALLLHCTEQEFEVLVQFF